MNKTSLFIIISAAIFGFSCVGMTKAGSDDNIAGYAWSENIGWISFNCINQGTCATSNYGVTINSGGDFSGYAWSENVGWINFAPAAPYPSAPNYSAKMVIAPGRGSGGGGAL